MNEFRLEWYPSRLQFNDYLTREVELCAEVLRKEPNLPWTSTLFSFQTWQRAKLLLRGKNAKRK